MEVVKAGDRVRVTCAIQRPDGSELEHESLSAIQYWITAGDTSKHPLVGLALVGMQQGEHKHVTPERCGEPTLYKIEVVDIRARQTTPLRSARTPR